MAKPELVTISIHEGAIVGRCENVKTPEGNRVHVFPVTLRGRCIVEATMQSDGMWGYMVGRSAYVACQVTATVLPSPAPELSA